MQVKKDSCECRPAELLKESDAITDALPGIELGGFSHENIQLHKWCTDRDLFGQ